MNLLSIPQMIFQFVAFLIPIVIKIYCAYVVVKFLFSLRHLVKNKWDFTITELQPKLVDFIKWKIIDISRIDIKNKEFKEFGLTLYANKQGSGKTVSMVEYLERMRKRYPDVMILTNFGYIYETKPLEGWQDLVNFRNGSHGVIFAIDELQNEFDSGAFKDVPEWLLGEVTQQRKQWVKIVSTSQVFTRVAKQFREQCFQVVECNTLFGRWTFQKAFDAYDYEAVIASPDKKLKLRRKYRRSFIMNDYIRTLFDTRKKIERINRDGFLPREQRPSRAV